MNNFNKLSLKIVIPLAFLAIFILLQGSVFFIEYQQEKTRLYEGKEQYLREVAGNLQTALSNSLMRSEKAQAQQIVSITALDANFKNIAIIDNNQQIVLSNELRHKYGLAELELPNYNGALLEQLISKNAVIFEHNSVTQELIVYAPLQMLAKGNGLSRKFNGIIFMRYSLNSAINALRYESLISLIEISTTLLFAILLLFYFIHHVVIRPINKLADSAKVSNLGREIHFDTSAIGEIGILQQSFAQLATEVSQNFNALTASEQRLLYALSGARDGVWDWDIENDCVYYSSRWKEMLGYQIDAIDNDIEEWEYRIHEEDLFAVLHDFKLHFIGKNSFFENTHRILCYNGEYRWILSRGQAVSWDSNGHPLRVIGTITDVSAYK